MRIPKHIVRASVQRFMRYGWRDNDATESYVTKFIVHSVHIIQGLGGKVIWRKKRKKRL